MKSAFSMLILFIYGIDTRFVIKVLFALKPELSEYNIVTNC